MSPLRGMEIIDSLYPDGNIGERVRFPLCGRKSLYFSGYLSDVAELANLSATITTIGNGAIVVKH
ncbi:hypothetical protein B0H03_1042 [Rathayibacter iranicus NCPPB 2253 = VKM Ac-1602]|uniref:Uncharacterized protein n=2 Tax=Rathayibacter iranicus TaxID=59737 RepID=A0ABX5LEL5_9MICO|nr:hypothetical protein B0H03_1042 [Rathayibacter iranicus NCPPB 2253 = VKM Ac-1602]